MLNELYLASKALRNAGVSTDSRHPRIQPMPKNGTTLIIFLNESAKPAALEFLDGENAEKLLRVEHGSAGSSFPGFNIPVPLLNLSEVSPEKTKEPLEKILKTFKSANNANVAAQRAAICDLTKLEGLKIRDYTEAQERQFQRSCHDLVAELSGIFKNEPETGSKLANFKKLLNYVGKNPMTLRDFCAVAIDVFVKNLDNYNAGKELASICEILFGTLDWKKRREEIGTSEYWTQYKAKNFPAKTDKTAKQPVYLDLAASLLDTDFKKVSHPAVGNFINEELIAQSMRSPDSGNVSGKKREGIDAYSGNLSELQDKHPAPRVAEIGNVKLFSVNTGEAGTLLRYGLENADAFPVAKSLVQEMSDTLLFLAGEENKGKTCFPIPGAQSEKRDLLIAYLENKGDETGDLNIAELFGSETDCNAEMNTAKFVARTENVLKMLRGKLPGNPDLRIRLFSLGAVDKANRQTTLNRTVSVKSLLENVGEWFDAARNVPPIRILWKFETKEDAKKVPVFHKHWTPSPIDLTTVLNRVWTPDTKKKGNFVSAYNRAFSVSDAYDIFIPQTKELELRKLRIALSLLVSRMSKVLSELQAARTQQRDANISDAVRGQCLKAFVFLGLLLKKLSPQTNDKTTYMKEPLYHLGQLLALADSLHQQYCKHVRDDERPPRLMGNALFNTALEQPKTALARLAERIAPYQAWAKNYKRADGGHGIWPAGKIKICAKRFIEDVNGVSHVRTDELPERMSDENKAKLLIGYLADTYEPEKTGEPNEPDVPSEEKDAS